ncbi:MAG TPA: helix-turn-helix transcriptional regulator [Dehalococcoidia bacterium]|nr:helix-turn-helix transcriptional regulator [Dehalococcoidia bacterium]
MRNPDTPLASYLRELRAGTELSLRDVERATNSVVSNVYLSQLENGTRSDPHPRMLVALARVYGVPWRVLFEKAGFVDEVEPSAIEVAFDQVQADPAFHFGTRFKGDLDESGKRVIIELYEKATGKKLLPNGD